MDFACRLPAKAGCRRRGAASTLQRRLLLRGAPPRVSGPDGCRQHPRFSLPALPLRFAGAADLTAGARAAEDAQPGGLILRSPISTSLLTVFLDDGVAGNHLGKM
ncbi:unnamed protein product [Prorocentrum cordatum]|uniref:Uncharacterized protein n=1 Tax=Prorocentrum cordatum TaxID=2364126 RepID=A0ABN9VTT6_9DINO|nr:unnamed protein product [Polarella glacialis]